MKALAVVCALMLTGCATWFNADIVKIELPDGTKWSGPARAYMARLALEARAETVVQRALDRGATGCPGSLDASQVEALGKTAAAAYYEAVEACFEASPQVAMHQAYAELGRHIKGAPSIENEGIVALARADADAQREASRRSSYRWGAVRTLGIAGAVAYAADRISENSGDRSATYQGNTVNQSQSINVGSNGEGGLTIPGDGLRQQNATIGEANRTLSTGEDGILSEAEKQVNVVGDSNLDGTTQAENSNTGVNLDDSGDGSDNQAGFNPFGQ